MSNVATSAEAVSAASSTQHNNDDATSKMSNLTDQSVTVATRTCRGAPTYTVTAT